MSSKRSATIESRDTAYKGKYAIEKIVFSFDAPDGSRRIEHAEREVFNRGDSAAALIHDLDRDVVVLTEQYRVATIGSSDGYILELAAGSVEEGEDAETCIRRELMEETGYRAGTLEKIAVYYASPGASSERIHLFYAPVRGGDLVDPAASGVAAENEAIARAELFAVDFIDGVRRGAFEDGKILLAGMWFALKRAKG
jgi:ADP-ribose pyrophosphatase